MSPMYVPTNPKDDFVLKPENPSNIVEQANYEAKTIHLISYSSIGMKLVIQRNGN